LEASSEVPIIDLGCGFGNDTLYLSERGYEVISCDYAIESLKIIEEFVPNPNTRLFNILDGLPFPDKSAKVVIADLSIHYFTWEDTNRVVRDIFRVLENGGYLLCRVNSTKDSNYGAGKGTYIEKNYYNIEGKLKRYFDKEQLELLFGAWGIDHLEEYTMNRYSKPKVVWELAVKK